MPGAVVGRVHAEGEGSSRGSWPKWIVQLILGQLCNGTAPSAILANIASHAARATPPHSEPSRSHFRSYSHHSEVYLA